MDDQQIVSHWQEHEIYPLGIQEIAATGRALLNTGIERSAVLVEVWRLAYRFVQESTKIYSGLETDTVDQIIVARVIYQAVVETMWP